MTELKTVKAVKTKTAKKKDTVTSAGKTAKKKIDVTGDSLQPCPSSTQAEPITRLRVPEADPRPKKILQYGYDVFKQYPTVLKGQFSNLVESVIPPEHTKKIDSFELDKQSYRIALEQRALLGITIRELFRHAIWTYLETLTLPSTFNAATGTIEKPKS